MSLVQARERLDSCSWVALVSSRTKAPTLSLGCAPVV